MQIYGLQKMTLLDFPERVACTVFLGGCNLRCPFCHNRALVFPDPRDVLDEEDFFAFLKKRAGILDGVAITGGEPLLTDITPFAERIKSMGFALKLDTNGFFPQRLRALVGAGLVDYVAMDIKNAPAKYAETCGLQAVDLSRVRESVDFLLRGTVPYEFRTTVVREFHEAEDFEAIGRWIAGAQGYYLQNFVDSGACICEGLHAHDEAQLHLFRSLLRKYVQNTQLRGV